VHGCTSEPVDQPPGLTPLTGQYRRPGDAWACFTRGPAPVFTKLTPRDDSDDTHFCVPVKSITVGHFLYYGAKLLQLLEEYPIKPV
jgi:hypothetical protein